MLDDDALTRKQVATMLGVRPVEVDELREKHDLPCMSFLFKGGRCYSRRAVKKWAKAHGKRIHDIPDPDYYQPSAVTCAKCGEHLLVHLNGGKYKCPSGCSLRSQFAAERRRIREMEERIRIHEE